MNRRAKTPQLRDAAEVRLRTLLATNLAEVDDTDLRRLVHELQVHQIELEMQNSELRQARSETEAALNRYTELYDFAPVGYLTLTPEGLVTEINLTGATLLGVERKSMRRKAFSTFVVHEEKSRWTKHFLSLKNQVDQGSVELLMQRGDGTVFHAQLDCLRHQPDDCASSQANAHSIRIALTDISARKRIEQERSLNQILQAGWYLLELINEILDLALIESGKLSASLSREAVDLTEVMLECRAMTEPQAKKRNVSVSISQPETAVFVKADRTRVKQVLINLLSNAIKYNKDGGRVTVECRKTTPGRIRISVRDTGEGMGPDRLLKLFQPFNRLGQEAKAQEGTGIGLVLCKRLTELMGGIIGVESVEGSGSVFWIELGQTEAPQPENTEEIQAIAQRPAANDGQVSTLLYVEDSPAHLMLVEEIVARRPDIRLLSARDGERGLKIARAFVPDVILMDINLPGINGISVLKTLAADPATAHIPVLALSANAIPHDVERGLWAGFFRYLTKPIKVSDFMESLDAALHLTAKKVPVAPPKKEDHDH